MYNIVLFLFFVGQVLGSREIWKPAGICACLCDVQFDLKGEYVCTSGILCGYVGLE